jgi:hypothetical protein
MLDFAPQKTKIVIDRVDGSLFSKDVNMKFANFLGYTYNLLAPISWAKVALKVKFVEKFFTFPNEVRNFTNKTMFPASTNI